jgi:uncharacterized protein
MDVWDAAEAGDLAELASLVDEDPSLLDSSDGIGRGYQTPLMLASQGGHLEVVRWLVGRGASINQQDDDGFTALYFGCLEGRTSVVRLLIERGADPTIAIYIGWSPLIAACAKGYFDIVQCLLGHPSAATFLNRRGREGKTALWKACCHGRAPVVRALLESGADFTIASVDGITPLTKAKEGPLGRDKDAGYKIEASVNDYQECVEALQVS